MRGLNTWMVTSATHDKAMPMYHKYNEGHADHLHYTIQSNISTLRWNTITSTTQYKAILVLWSEKLSPPLHKTKQYQYTEVTNYHLHFTTQSNTSDHKQQQQQNRDGKGASAQHTRRKPWKIHEFQLGVAVVLQSLQEGVGKIGGVLQSLLDDVVQVGHATQGLDRREQWRHQVAQQQVLARPCLHNATESQLLILEQGFLGWHEMSYAMSTDMVRLQFYCCWVFCFNSLCCVPFKKQTFNDVGHHVADVIDHRGYWSMRGYQWHLLCCVCVCVCVHALIHVCDIWRLKLQTNCWN